jgi:hypothetical protein
MSRVIDDDAKARRVLEDTWGCLNHNPIVRGLLDNTLQALRQETPNWWEGIDPDDYKTFVDSVVWNEGDKPSRSLVTGRSEDGDRRFYCIGGRFYRHAEPFVKESKDD